MLVEKVCGLVIMWLCSLRSPVVPRLWLCYSYAAIAMHVFFNALDKSDGNAVALDPLLYSYPEIRFGKWARAEVDTLIASNLLDRHNRIGKPEWVICKRRSLLQGWRQLRAKPQQPSVEHGTEHIDSIVAQLVAVEKSLVDQELAIENQKRQDEEKKRQDEEKKRQDEEKKRQDDDIQRKDDALIRAATLAKIKAEIGNTIPLYLRIYRYLRERFGSK